jgi:GntR family transcriptional regulator/MocR family aminotransferase
LVAEKSQFLQIHETIPSMGSKPYAGAEIALGPRKAGTTLTQWLYEELRFAILGGRLKRGARIPATRDFARQYGLSRRTVVTVFEQLRDEGYTESRTGDGTRVGETLPDDFLQYRTRDAIRPRPSRRGVTQQHCPPTRPFNPIYPAVAEFPCELWARLASRRLRRLTVAALSAGEIGGYGPLRQAIAEHVGASRGVNCTPDQVIVTSGMHQGLDLIRANGPEDGGPRLGGRSGIFGRRQGNPECGGDPGRHSRG